MITNKKINKLKILSAIFTMFGLVFVSSTALAQNTTTTDSSTDPTAISATTISAQTTITGSLDIGSTGNDVNVLQNFLAKDTSIYPEGLITGYYGKLTASAVSKFQTKYGIDAVGRVGPVTRNKINELIQSGGLGGNGGVGVEVGVAPAISNITTSSTTVNSDGTKSITISWQTNKPTRGKVFYSSSPLTFSENNSSMSEPTISGNVLLDANYGITKSLSISNLPATTTTYNYMIEAIDSSGNVSVTWPNTFLIQ